MTDKTLPNPVNETTANDDQAVVVEATVLDERTGARWVHKDLVQVRADWDTWNHIGPPKSDEKFGDVESWASFVTAYGQGSVLLTWSSQGLRAVLDYHADDEHAGRCQWFATMPFEKSPEWKAWLALCDGQARSQRRAIEALEDLSQDITEPPPAEFMNLLRNLRAAVNATAQTELLPDGTTRVGFSRDSAVRGITATDMALPAEFSITLPILKGHDVRYKLAVRLRTSIDDQAHLTFRFTIPQAERALETVYAAIVASAKTLLGDGFSLLRAAG